MVVSHRTVAFPGAAFRLSILFGLAAGILTAFCPADGLFSGVRSEVTLVGPKQPSRGPNCQIEFFDKKGPERPSEVVARIDVYVRRNKISQGRQAVYEEAVPEFRKQACKVGADAVVVIRQTVSQAGEFKLLYVKAEAIRYKDSPPPQEKK